MIMHRLPAAAGTGTAATAAAADLHVFSVQDVWAGYREDERGPNVRYGDAFTICAGKSKAGVLYVDGKRGGAGDPDVRGEQCILRLLTPRECERVQGLPDDHTRWGADGEELSNKRRYNMVGRAVPPPAVAAIASRIPPHMAADAASVSAKEGTAA